MGYMSVFGHQEPSDQGDQGDQAWHLAQYLTKGKEEEGRNLPKVHTASMQCSWYNC